MTNDTDQWENLKSIGASAYDSIAELVSAMETDDDDARDDARERILEDALEVRVLGERRDGEWTADRYEMPLVPSVIGW